MILDQPAPGMHRLSPRTVSRVADALRASANQSLAQRYARISAPTFRSWREQGYADLVRWCETHDLDVADLDFEAFLLDVPFAEQPFVHFVLECEKAIADFELENLAAIREEGHGHTVTETTVVESFADGKMTTTTTTKTIPRKSWQASAWLLERAIPEDYARVTRQEHTGKDGAPLEIDVGDAALERVKASLARMKENRDTSERLILEATSTDTT